MGPPDISGVTIRSRTKTASQLEFEAKIMHYRAIEARSAPLFAGSSNGRMRLSESRHLGSNPSPAANLCEVILHETHCLAKSPKAIK